MKTSNTGLMVLGLLLIIVHMNEAIFFPKNKVIIRHVHLEPTGGEWRQQQVWKEVWHESPHGEWKQEWKEEWANVRVPGPEWDQQAVHKTDDTHYKH